MVKPIERVLRSGLFGVWDAPDIGLSELPPGLNPRTRELAQQMRSDPGLARGGPAALVQAALERLRTGGYSYTLDPGTYGLYTSDEFWFDR